MQVVSVSVQHVVHVEVALVERPVAAERAVDHADDLLRLDARRRRGRARLRRVSGTFFQSCVPRGSQRSTYSAPAMASAQALAVRLSVDRNSRPPGFTSRPQRLQEQLDVGHVLDDLQRQHDVELRARCRPAPRRWPAR